jgi:hypothetical protein
MQDVFAASFLIFLQQGLKKLEQKFAFKKQIVLFLPSR